MQCGDVVKRFDPRKRTDSKVARSDLSSSVRPERPLAGRDRKRVENRSAVRLPFCSPVPPPPPLNTPVQWASFRGAGHLTVVSGVCFSSLALSALGCPSTFGKCPAIFCPIFISPPPPVFLCHLGIIWTTKCRANKTAFGLTIYSSCVTVP
ncbi:hypothetical protein B0T25DRAFT_155496 [Lasiosphaeria hispida]|uniref:Uncharacterized protein n=1 Tax=Lasiosphaeria hispida TaxID=260671 RepID=A0AAJ0HM29_9PEZI|nr:hypothetical protein B0T25DRAFT_155496 [Lasiosphaeria hispida]